MRLAPYCAFALVLIPFASGCKQEAHSADDGHGHGQSSPATSDENIRQLKELKKTDVKVGTGETCRAGDMISVSYTGKLKNGFTFDSNEGEGSTPLVFVVGEGAVIPGWDQGIPGMKVGGIRKIDVPNNLAYGDQAQGEKVPPGADLYFEVKLLDVVHPEDAASFEKKDLKVGTGAACKVGDLVEVTYTMKLANGKVVDKFLDKNSPIVFRIGKRIKDGDREVPSGISAAMVGMRIGGTRWMRIPPQIGYAYSANPKLPAGNVVFVEMTLHRIQP